jgi:aminoglycoside phosphotransferase (APT) family kinase protein
LPGRPIEPDTTEPDASSHLQRLLISDGVIHDRTAILTPLSGGVSSEIYLISDGRRQLVVKRALPKLKVQQEWFADTSRNGNEAACLGYIARFLPGNVPQLKYVSAEHGYFCMEYLGADWQNWKTVLLDGRCDLRIAQAVGALLGRIHAHSASDPEARERFQTLANFEQLRIEPYLLATARRHPRLKEVFEAEASRLRAARSVLAHGDFSPKNILVCAGRVVIVDCEVAWYGDAAFDIAFLLSHLFLKSAALPAAGSWRAMIELTWSAYQTGRFSNEAGFGQEVLEAQVARLLPMLMLARVDGKSPVEYLRESQQEHVRKFAIARFERSRGSLPDLAKEWFT